MEGVFMADQVKLLLTTTSSPPARLTRRKKFNFLVAEEVRRCKSPLSLSPSHFCVYLDSAVFGKTVEDIHFVVKAGYSVVKREEVWVVTLPVIDSKDEIG